MSITVVGSPLGLVTPLVIGSWLDNIVKSGGLSYLVGLKLIQKVVGYSDNNQTSAV